MRAATVVLAATLLAGTQAAVVPRSVTETTTAVTETATETPTVEALTTTTDAMETTTEAFTTSTGVIEATETTTATPTTEVTETATAEIAPVTWADCEESTVPHSTACVKKWFHAAGCMNRELPAEKAEGWANNEDIAAIESDMAELYANATAMGDSEDKAAFEACEPMPKPIMQVFDCVDNVMTDTCATCFTPKKFLGMNLPVMNGTCLGECFHNEADKLAQYCPNLNQMVSCHDTLKKTCGKCMKKEGKLLGLHIMDVNDDCFERCYWKNKDDIRAACPLPEPMKKAVDCHEALAEQCDECVGDDHEVDVKCLDGCFTEKSAQNETLKEMCPERLTAGMTTLAELMPTEEELEMFFEQLLSNVELPFNLNLETIFDTIGKLMDNAYPGHGHHGDGKKPHHHDDDHDHDHDHDHEDSDDEDDDDGDDHMENMGQNIAQFVQGFLNGDMHNNTEVQTAINGVLQQVLGNLGMNTRATTTALAEPTETETETSTPEETETETSTPDETETETSTPDETETETETMAATTTATAEPTESMDDDVELAPESENPLLSFLESFVSKILNYENEAAASASATATATSAVEATTTETVSESTATETQTETETSTETSTPTADDATTTEAATTTA